MYVERAAKGAGRSCTILKWFYALVRSDRTCRGVYVIYAYIVSYFASAYIFIHYTHTYMHTCMCFRADGKQKTTRTTRGTSNATSRRSTVGGLSDIVSLLPGCLLILGHFVVFFVYFLPLGPLPNPIAIYKFRWLRLQQQLLLHQFYFPIDNAFAFNRKQEDRTWNRTRSESQLKP